MSRWLPIAILACAGLCSGRVRAEPWMAPGDEALRSDIELLADSGIIHGPVTTWPLSWPDIARDVESVAPEKLDAVTAAALMRVRRRADLASARGYGGARIRASGATDSPTFRGFEDTPREEGELEGQLSWMGDHFAINLDATVVAEPEDDQTVRPDGSYLGVNLGNVMLSAGYMDRWWGPGWEGSLIYSNNARPMPALTIERNRSNAFETKWLSWLGPWRASVTFAQSDTHDVPIEDVKFFAARFTFKPLPWMEFGLSRTAQMCGEGRSCDWDDFWNMLSGDDNQYDDGTTNAQPGNQLAGYDFRLRSPWRRLPLVFYGQMTGEDEAGGMPSKFLGLFGLETWFGTGIGALRVHAEYADTTCSFSRETPEFNCAYLGVYPQGYTYGGRPIGHTMDGDSRMFSAAGLLTRENGDVFALTYRSTDVNRDGSGRNSISATPLNVRNVELRYSRAFRLGKLNVGLGYEDRGSDVDPGDPSQVQGFLTWQQGF